MEIKNELEYSLALRRVDELWHAREGSPEREELCALMSSVLAYDLDDRQFNKLGKKTKKARLLKELRERLQNGLAFDRGQAANLRVTEPALALPNAKCPDALPNSKCSDALPNSKCSDASPKLLPAPSKPRRLRLRHRTPPRHW